MDGSSGRTVRKRRPRSSKLRTGKSGRMAPAHVPVRYLGHLILVDWRSDIRDRTGNERQRSADALAEPRRYDPEPDLCRVLFDRLLLGCSDGPHNFRTVQDRRRRLGSIRTLGSSLHRVWSGLRSDVLPTEPFCLTAPESGRDQYKSPTRHHSMISCISNKTAPRRTSTHWPPRETLQHTTLQVLPHESFSVW